MKEFVAGGQQLTNAVVPEMKAWKPKISEHLNEQLCNKVIVENWISTEHVASDKYLNFSKERPLERPIIFWTT